jgi:hypothetical protein
MAKFPKSIPGGRIGNFLAGAAVASVIGGTAVAVTSANFTYSQSQRGYYTIHAMAMAPSDNFGADDYSISYVPPFVSSGGGACLQTGVNFPQGATVLSVTTWYQSNASSNLGVRLYRQNLPSNGFNTLVSTVVTDDTNTRKAVTHTVAANLRTVNNLYFSYGYGVCIADGTTFSGARISYLYKTAGD